MVDTNECLHTKEVQPLPMSTQITMSVIDKMTCTVQDTLLRACEGSRSMLHCCWKALQMIFLIRFYRPKVRAQSH